MDHFLLSIPLWAVFVVTLVIAAVSVEGGYVWAKRRQERSQREKEAPVGTMVGATLGLLAFLLAFTFGIASDAFHARKLALVNEANAIRMTYLLTDAIPPAHRAEIRALLREYVDERLRWADGTPNQPGKSARELLDRFWKSAAAVGEASPGNVDVFLSYAGRIIELEQERVMVRERSRIPAPYWIVLTLIAMLALATVGYHCGVAGASRSPAMIAVAIAFSTVIMLIADLNRPGEGFINVSQQPMQDLRDYVRTRGPQ